MSGTDPPALEQALRLADLGMALLPIAPGTKRPHSDLLPRDPKTGAPQWSPLGLRPASPAEIREWFDRDPRSSIGVICGPTSGLAVLDFDGPVPRGLHMPLTPMSETGRGVHIFVGTSTPLTSGKMRSPNGRVLGDIKANGYVVLPPSLHPSGKAYSWYDGLAPWDVDLAEPPEWVRAPLAGGSVPEARLEGGPSNEYALLGPPRSSDIGAAGVAKLIRLPGYVKTVAPLLRIPLECATEKGIGKPFLCVIPGHEETSPSASLNMGANGIAMYRDWHAKQGIMFYSLPEVRASQAYGEGVQLNDPETITWQLRMLAEAGWIQPALVPMPPLAPGSSSTVRRVHEGFRLLLGCRWVYTPWDPTPFSRRFAAAWCGVTERHAGEAITELMRGGVIRKVKQHKRTGLFLPGDRA